MRTASLVLGIIGGVFGIIAGLLALTIGGVGAAFDASGAESIAGRSFVAVLVGVIGIVGGALAPRYPKPAAVLQLISCIVGLILIGLFWIFSAILLLIGAALAFFGWRTRSVTIE